MTEPAPAPGGFPEHTMINILNRACQAVGLDSSSSRLLRGHTNAVVLLGTAPVVVKIARQGTPVHEVMRTVRLVQWLADSAFPTVPLFPGITQPQVIDGHPVTFWTYLPQSEENPVAAEQIAKPLSMLHTLTAPDLDLPHHDNVRAIRSSLAKITSLDSSVMAFLADRTNRLEADLAQVEFALPAGLLQGDPQHRNALHDGGGGVVLCDWDTVCTGQPEWDLVTIEVHCRRFGYPPSHYQAFATAYGFDVRQWGGYSILRDLRELRMVTTNARKTRHAPGSLHEVRQRVDGLVNEDHDRLWNIL
ncbi:phosphotransferase enzyme family protein [Streptomyces sp. NPDC006703]|uniref:phosphotransferase enzyme family protein n=1 Tax=Streptomyces sp. NPDC006703 TaxID=3364759 RepID=UPI0036C91373